MTDASGGRLFLSHAHHDERLSGVFLDLLTGAGLSESRIFYSSVRSTGIESGRPVEQVLREELQRSRYVIQLISPSFMASPMCLMELGAAWVLEIPRLPIVVAPLSRGDVSASIGNFQMGQLVSSDDLQSVLDDCHNALVTRLHVTPTQPTWRRLSVRFKEQLEALSSSPQAPSASSTDGRHAGAPVPMGGDTDEILFSNASFVLGRRGRELLAEITNADKVGRSGIVSVTFYSASGAIVGTARDSFTRLGPEAKRTATFRPVPDHHGYRFDVVSLF